MSVATELKVMYAMMESEITELAGPRGAHDPERAVGRHGCAPTSVTLRARRVPVDRPRARTADGRKVPLSIFAAFVGDDLFSAVVMADVAGLASPVHRGRTKGSLHEPRGLTIACGLRLAWGVVGSFNELVGLEVAPVG